LTQFQIQPRSGGVFLLPYIDTVQGFYFYPAAGEPLTSIYSGFSDTNVVIPPQRQKRLQGFTATFPLI
jgi:hypothetical protein